MKKKENSIQKMTLILLIGLTSFLTTSCRSQTTIIPARPAKPQQIDVEFKEKDGGLWLSYDNYRALEYNIIAMREYIKKLEAYSKALEKIIYK